MEPRWTFIFVAVLLYCSVNVFANKQEKKPVKKIGKDVRDMSDAELETLYDQWEEDEEPLEPDELPEHLRPQQKIDISQIDMTNHDSLLKLTKKGKSIMMFVDVKEELSESEANNILSIWHTSLQNNHIIAERYPIDTKRAIYMFKDGAQAVDAKNFLIEQPELSHVTLEGQNFPGKHASKATKEKLERQKPKGTVEKVEL